MAKAQLEFSAGGIVFKHEGEKVWFALIYNSYGQWTFPKGHIEIEKKEKPEAAAQREVTEEIGITDLKVLSLLDKIDYWFKLEGILYHKYVYFFLMEAPASAKLIPQEAEVGDAQWFDPSEAKKRLFYKEDFPILEKAIEQTK